MDILIFYLFGSCYWNTKEFAAGAYQVPCALIIGQRKASTDLKTSLNNALREYNVAV
jgi:2,3,4,5-tetrahydropyridine-2-carboxylate N-succinyltransferase